MVRKHTPRDNLAAGVVPLIAAVVVGCADRAPPPLLEATTRDSAGVRIVENPAPERANIEQWTISAHPVGEIGTDDGPEPYLLHNVDNIAVFADGRIAVGMMGRNEIAIYDSMGIYIESVGRKGSGPGELAQRGNFFTIDGDTLIVYDRFRQEMSFFGPDLRYLKRTRVIRPSGTPDLVDLPAFLIADAFSDGTLLIVRHPGERKKPPGAPPDSAKPMRIRLDGTVVTPFTKLGGSRPLIAITREQVIVPREGSFGLLSGKTGELTTTVRNDMRAGRKPPLPASMIDDTAAIRAWQRLPESYPPLRIPYFGDDEGNVWARPSFGATDSTIAWLVFDSTGVLRAAVHNEPGTGRSTGTRHHVLLINELRVGTIAIRRGSLVVVTEDSLGIQRVSRYAVTRPR